MDLDAFDRNSVRMFFDYRKVYGGRLARLRDFLPTAICRFMCRKGWRIVWQFRLSFCVARRLARPIAGRSCGSGSFIFRTRGRDAFPQSRFNSTDIYPSALGDAFDIGNLGRGQYVQSQILCTLPSARRDVMRTVFQRTTLTPGESRCATSGSPDPRRGVHWGDSSGNSSHRTRTSRRVSPVWAR
jgi:hypothetical protein